MRKKLCTVLVTTLMIAVCFIENAFGVPIDEANFPDPGFRSQVRQYDTGWTEYDSDGKAYLVGNGDGVLDWPDLNCDENTQVVYGNDTPGGSGSLINSSNFPDENFRNYISTVFDPDGDGIITDDEIAGITGIEAVGLGIKSMKGIEYFTALEYLTCDGNELTGLDLSGNPELRGLSANNNQLSSLNVSNNPKLYQVWLSFNFLTEADFTQNPELAILDCSHNLLTSLNVSDNPNLISLAFGNFEEWEEDVSKWGGNRIRTIDLSNNPLLENLSCEGNEMESLNISGNTSLKTLNCGWNNISALDISNNPLIMHLDCGGNNLTALNVGHLEELQTLHCWDNRLTALDVSHNSKLELLNCDNCAVTELNLGSNSNLANLSCSWNKLTNLNLSNLVNLRNLDCENNFIKDLALGSLTSLDSLNCNNNPITEIDLTKNTLLVNLGCGEDFASEPYSRPMLTKIDLSKNELLENAYLCGNRLTEINVRSNKNLVFLDLQDNELSEIDVSGNENLQYLSLRNILNPGGNEVTSLNLANNPNLKQLFAESNKLTAVNVAQNTLLEELNVSGNPIGSLSLSSNKNLKRLWCSGCGLNALEVSHLTELEVLDCGYNKISVLNVSSNSKIAELYCSNSDAENSENRITALNVTNKPELRVLDCSGNRIAEINVTGSPLLEMLNVAENPIGTLDLRNNTKLKALWCHHSLLETLDISNCNELEMIDCSDNNISSLNTAGKPALQEVYCSNNKIKALDLSGSPLLRILHARENQLASLNINGCIQLESINVRSNALTGTLDLSGRTALREVYCRNNQLSGLNLDGCYALEDVSCQDNRITALDVSNRTSLRELWASRNELKALNVSGCSALKALGCNNNSISGLDLNASVLITELWCFSNDLSALDVSGMTELKKLGFSSNRISVINVKNNPLLEELEAHINPISNLDVSKNPKLRILVCRNTQISTLDVTNNPELEELYCNGNSLSTLDLTANTKLISVDCYANSLVTLKIDNCAELVHLHCRNNKIPEIYIGGCPKLTDFEYDSTTKILRERPKPGIAPTITTKALTDAERNKAYTFRLEASGTKPIRWTHSGGLPEGLSMNESGLISGTPTFAQKYTFTVTAANSYGSASATFTLQVTGSNPGSKPTITTDTTMLTIPTGKAFSLQLAATGTTPITWTKSGTLPTGLNLSSSGLISGTPKSAQTKTFKVTAKNKIGSDTKSFTITTYVPVSITTAKLADGTADKNYNATLKAKGSNVVWSATGLPDGLSINAKTGKISGKTSKYGEYKVKVRADNSSTHEEKTFTLTIKGVAPTISGSLKTPELNKSYSSGLKVKGTQPIEWSISGNLPDGLTFNEETGVISGTPTSYLKSGYKITITAKGPGGSKSKTVTLKVKGTAPTITGTLKQAELYKAYSATLKVKGSDTIKLSMSGKLPDGLTFDEKTGTISGTPTSYLKSGYKFTVTATNPVGSKSKTFTLKVKGTAPTISGSLKSPELNKAYSGSLKVKGTEPITWSMSGELPDGLTFDEETGTISGTATSYSKSGYKITITASNIVGTKSKKITLKVKGTAPSIKTTKLPNATQWSSYSVALNATGSDPITWRAEGLPSGLSLNGNTIDGTPTVSGKKFTVTVYAENPVKEVKKNLSLRIDAAEKPDTVKDTKSPKDTETSPTEPTDKSTPPEQPEQEVPESPEDDEDTAHPEGEYVVVARLGEISRDVEGMYDFDVTLSDDAIMGAELVYIANSSEPSNDDEIAEFFDDTGKEISEVPDNRHITISIWLRKNVIYNPAVAVRN